MVLFHVRFYSLKLRVLKNVLYTNNLRKTKISKKNLISVKINIFTEYYEVKVERKTI